MTSVLYTARISNVEIVMFVIKKMINFKDIGSNPVGDSDFSLPHACDIMNRSFLISSTSLKFTTFLHLKHDDFDIADPHSMQDACHT